MCARGACRVALLGNTLRRLTTKGNLTEFRVPDDCDRRDIRSQAAGGVVAAEGEAARSCEQELALCVVVKCRKKKVSNADDCPGQCQA